MALENNGKKMAGKKMKCRVGFHSAFHFFAGHLFAMDYFLSSFFSSFLVSTWNAVMLYPSPSIQSI